MKLLLWLARWTVRIAITAGLSLFSAWFVVNMYVESMLQQFQLSNVGKKIQFSDVLARLGEDWHIIKARPGIESAQGRSAPVTAQPAAPDGTTGAGTRPGGGIGGEAPGSKPSQAEEKVPEDAVAVSGRLSQGGGARGGSARADSGLGADSGTNSGSGSVKAGKGLEGLVVSSDDFAKKKAAMSSEDKMKLFSVLASKLPPEQLQRISALVEDGITADEMKQIDAILRKYLSKEDYKQILDIIQKY